MEQDGCHFPIVRPLRLSVHDHRGEGRNQHDQVYRQVGGAGLQRPAVQSLVLIPQTNHSDSEVGECDAAEGGAQDNGCAGKAVDVVDEKILAGKLEQRGIVAEWVDYNPPAARQAESETHDDRDKDEGHHPGSH